MSEITWAIQKVKLSELKEYEHNPRTLSTKKLEHLEESISKFGMAEPLVLNADYTICGGHGRKKILERLKIAEVDCYIPNRSLNEQEFDELNIRLNKNTAGDFNIDILSNRFDIDELKDIGFSLRDLGLDSAIEYKPELDPNYAKSILTDSDMQKAQQKEDERFGLDRPKKQVICPNCFTEFEIEQDK
jgi:site-specific DNA-methyltransferase (adenine-specific)